MNKFIVAEITKNWNADTNPDLQRKDLLSQRFELVINTNAARGYKLIDWKISSVVHDGTLTETIIAIFEKTTTE